MPQGTATAIWGEGGPSNHRAVARACNPVSLGILVYSSPPLVLPPALGLLPPASAIVSVATIPQVSLSLLPASESTSIVPSTALPLPSTPSTLMVDTPHPRLSAGIEPSGVKLSSTFPPFPAKLVTKVQGGQYVDMKGLLTDNIALQSQLDALHSQPAVQLPAAVRPRLREVGSPLVWIYCFLAYAALRTPDQATRNLLTYARLLMREALHHGGLGWLEYDRVFRQQAALDPTCQWNKLNASLFAATVLCSRSTPGTACSLCQEADHQTQDCALGFFQHPPSYSSTPPSSGWSQHHIHPAQGAPSRRSPPATGQPRRTIRPETVKKICVSWNRGVCSFPGSCSFRHICATCQTKDHQARDCPDTPDDSEYKARARWPPGSYRRVKGQASKPVP